MTIVNSAGETPKDVARRFGRLACVSILGGDTGIMLLRWLPTVICIIYISITRVDRRDKFIILYHSKGL